MKNKKTLSLAISAFLLTVSGCGGENATIFEDPNKGVITSSNGCNINDERCMGFTVGYPVEGLNFVCSSDNQKFYITQLVGNSAEGGCPVGDKVSFYIQGESSSRKINLGTIDLKKINPLNTNLQPAQISILDMAKGLTGKDAITTTLNDDTFKTMVGITRIFQAVGISQNSNIAGDVQPIYLTVDLKNRLSVLTADVTANDFTDGTYESDISAWLGLNSLSESIAASVAEKLVQLKNVGIFTADSFTFEAANADVKGFSGKSQLDNDSIANLYSLTTREGYTVGYTLQWKGKPVLTSEQKNTSLTRLLLATQVSPQKLNIVDGIKNWINPLNDKVSTPLIFKSAPTAADQLNIFQGTILSQKIIPGSEYVYKQVTGSETAPDNSVYGKWNQDINNERFTGSIDILQTNPVSFLDRAVFKSSNTVNTGENYIFPLYATLEFKFDDRTIPTQSIGIVIEESGDIRTNLTANGAASDRCLIVDNTTMKDSAGVQQYRIGTTGAANDSTNDKSITIRMILANPVFGNLDGVIVGLNRNISNISGSDQIAPTVFSNGVRLNLQNLIVSNTTSSGINITGFAGNNSFDAQWVNMHSVFQTIYNTSNTSLTTSTQQDLAKRLKGTIGVSLPSCYQIKTKV